MRKVGFRSKRVFHCDAVSHSEFLPYSEHVLRVVNGARTLVFKGSCKCLGADVLAEHGVDCISKEQLDHYFVRNTQEAAFQHIVLYRQIGRAHV